MTKSEFESRIENSVSNKDYEIIEKVYTYHPSVSETKGKEEIAYIYRNFGMRVIKDMLATAKEVEEIQTEIQSLKLKLETLTVRYEVLKH